MANNSKTLVLVADDEPSTLAMVSSHLRARGYKVLEASDGDQAWELAHEHLPHLVVLDVMMPGMSGWEVCRKIREAVSLAHTGVVMLTGIGENLNEMTSPLYGADAYVDKPFEFAVLDKKIKETLSRRSSGAVGRPDDGAVETSAEFLGSDAEAGTLPGVGRTSLPKPAARAKSDVPPTGPRAPKKVVRAAPKPAAAKPPAAPKQPATPKKPAKAAKKTTAAVKKAPAKKLRSAAKKSAKKPAKTPARKAGKSAVKQAPAKKAKAKQAKAKKTVAKKPAAGKSAKRGNKR
jgi:CheY-like chemotaxis protein